ncbi:hypothetical protein BH10BAC2_BH10BAC2_35190 [soil metagenome]
MYCRFEMACSQRQGVHETFKLQILIVFKKSTPGSSGTVIGIQTNHQFSADGL